ncbi:MAG TPA: cupin domain-containing protein [Stellaceae bacterium]|nr:cupin domain-containing protein [Stellaceae bacterium]
MRALKDLSQAASLDELYPMLHARSIMPGWHKPRASLYPEPHKNFRPMHWSWREGKDALDAAGRLISTEQAHRRNLLLYNPADEDGYAALRTLVAAYQMILPGETAPSHRHSGNALRVILEGEGAYTVVEGERFDMHPNDVLLTPDWHWHGHGCDAAASGPCYWLDGLDTPLVHLLEPMFLETMAGLQPGAPPPPRSPYIFTWEATQAALDQAPPDPEGHFGRRIELGSPAMVTTALYMQRHDSGTRTPPRRTTSNQFFCVIEGRGTTTVDGERFAWARGDVLAVPMWRPFEHEFASDATLFSMTDEPVMRAFNWLRTRNA